MLLTLGEHVIDCTARTAIMGILNVASDSPVAGSVRDVDAAVGRALELHAAGAAIIDMGAHSTRTGGRDLTAQEEIERLCPVVAAVAAEGIPVSVDSWNAEVARAAVMAGASLLNDVTGLTDPAMIAVSAELGVPAVIMHMRGEPKHHLEADQQYDDIAAEVRSFLLERAAAASAAGAPRPWFDPGFEFGKSLDDNLRMLLGLPALVAEGYPVLISASRKGFLAELLGYEKRQDVAGLLEATLAFNSLAAYLGAHVVRVHDVAAAVYALRVVDGVRLHAYDSLRDGGQPGA